MVFTKLPAKVEGATSTVDGHEVVCVDKPYNGQSQLKWVYKSNGNPVYRKINGKIQIVSPTGESGNTESPKASVQTVNFPTISEEDKQQFASEIDLENAYTAIAVEIVKARNPDLKENEGTFGMIVSATASRLVALRKA